MEFVIEIIIEIYMELMLLVVPEKNVSKKHIITAKVIAVAVVIAVIALLIWGMVLIIDMQNLWGLVPVCAAVAISLAQIIAGIVLFKKHH